MTARRSILAAAVILPILLMAAIACGSDSSTGSVLSGLPTTTLGEEFILGPGAAIAVDAGNETVRVDFISVDSDARCPAGAVCVVPGDARIFLGVTPADGLRRSFAVVVPPRGTVGSELQGYKLTLVKLLPDPPPQRVQPGTYRATLKLERVS